MIRPGTAAETYRVGGCEPTGTYGYGESNPGDQPEKLTAYH